MAPTPREEEVAQRAQHHALHEEAGQQQHMGEMSMAPRFGIMLRIGRNSARLTALSPCQMARTVGL
jgi:hypothetical protein